MSKQYFIPQSVWTQVEAVEAAADQAVSPSTPGTWYAVAGMATQDTLTTIAPTYTVSLGAIRDGQTVGPPGSGTDVEASLSGSDGSPPGSYAWSATVNDAAASLPITAVAGTDIVLAISDAAHPLGAFSASSDPVTVTATETAPAQMSAPVLSVDSASQITATLAADPDDGGSAITGHDLRHSTDEANWTEVTGITSPHAITGLAASTTHYVQTRAVNAVGAGSWSTSAKAATTAATQLTATPNTSGTIDITLGDGTFTVTIDGATHPHQNGTWGPFDTADLNSGPINVVPANVTGSAGLGDTLTAAPGVWVWDKGNGTATTSAIWQRNEIDISGEMKATYTIALADDTASLRYQETATDKAGSVLQASNAIPVADFTEPAQMSAPSLTVVSNTEIRVNRAAAPADGSADITQYDLRYSTDEVNWKIVTDISAPESIANLTASTIYYVQTRAMNVIGAGAWSASTSATTNALVGGIADPTEVGAIIWLDGTDWRYQKQNIAGTTAVTAAGQEVRYLVDRSGSGNDFRTRDGSGASTSASGAITWRNAFFKPDASLTGLTANMEIYVLLSTKDTIWCLLGKNGGGSHGIFVQDGSTSDAVISGGFAGTITLSTDGVDVAGTPTRDDMHAEWSIEANVIAGARGFDLSSATNSTMASNLMPLAYTTSFGGFPDSALHIVVTPSLTTQQRSDLIDWFKSEGGII